MRGDAASFESAANRLLRTKVECPRGAVVRLGRVAQPRPRLAGHLALQVLDEAREHGAHGLAHRAAVVRVQQVPQRGRVRLREADLVALEVLGGAAAAPLEVADAPVRPVVVRELPHGGGSSM